MDRTLEKHRWKPADPTAKYVFVFLLFVLLTVAVGHLYAIQGLTTLVGGLPAWIWIQLVVVFVMLFIAWITVSLWPVPESQP